MVWKIEQKLFLSLQAYFIVVANAMLKLLIVILLAVIIKNNGAV